MRTGPLNPTRDPAAQTQLRTAAHLVGRFRQDTWACQDDLGEPRIRASTSIWALPPSIGYRHWAAARWLQRATACTQRLQRRTLPETGDWETAVRIAQRPYPGTGPWLWSCSGAEGGHSEWVTYGGGHYTPGFEHRYIVGGPMQYKWPTFKGHYRHALDDLQARGFIVPADLRDPGNVRAWLSMTAQALAAGWARATGNDRPHWSASSGNGC